jgi:hypothetical protein
MGRENEGHTNRRSATEKPRSFQKTLQSQNVTDDILATAHYWALNFVYTVIEANTCNESWEHVMTRCHRQVNCIIIIIIIIIIINAHIK